MRTALKMALFETIIGLIAVIALWISTNWIVATSVYLLLMANNFTLLRGIYTASVGHTNWTWREFNHGANLKSFSL